MTLFGKILIFLNLLAFGAFAYFASVDWQKHQEWALAAFTHEIKITGLPLDYADPKPTDINEDQVAFLFRGEQGTAKNPNPINSVYLDRIRKSTLTLLVPKGNALFGGAEGDVANQMEEIKRVQKVLSDLISKADGAANRRRSLLQILHNLATTAEERDGLYALLRDLHFPGRADIARTDLPLLGLSAARNAALTAISQLSSIKSPLELQDNVRVSNLRKGLIEAGAMALPDTITIPSSMSQSSRADKRNEILRIRTVPLNNLIKAIKSNPIGKGGNLDPLKQALVQSAEESDRPGLQRIADIVAAPLASKSDVDAVLKLLEDQVFQQINTESQKKYLTDLLGLIKNPRANIEEASESIAKDRLDLWFAEIYAPITTASPNLTGKMVPEDSEKRTKIAHILFHMDSNQNWEDREAWQQRVQAIVGIKEYVNVIEIQASQFALMSQRLRQLTLQDQGIFEAEYSQLIQQATYLANEAVKLNRQLDNENTLAAEHQVNLEVRRTELEELKTRYASLKKSIEEAMSQFTQEQQKVLDLSRKLRLEEDKLFENEEKIRELEKQLNK